MEFIGNLFAWFVHGGIVMYPLLACSILVVAITVERQAYYRRHCAQMSDVAAQIEMAARAADWTAIEKTCGKNQGILSNIISTGVRHRGCMQYMKESFEQMTVAETTGLRRHLSYLDTVVTMAPLLGLLGTVVGMIGSFQVLDTAGSNPSVITGSVGEALIATATGLCVAVLALSVHTYFAHRLNDVITKIEAVCICILEKSKGECREFTQCED